MKLINGYDQKISDRHEELTKQLKDAEDNHLKISEDYYLGNGTEQKVIDAHEKLKQILEEWRNTLFTLPKK